MKHYFDMKISERQNWNNSMAALLWKKTILILVLLPFILVGCGDDEEAPPPPNLQIPESDDTFSSVLTLPPKKPAKLKLTPAEVAFKGIQPGRSANKVVIASNIGQEVLTINNIRNVTTNSNIDVSGSCDNDLDLEPGQSCDLTITFNGGSIGQSSGEIILFHNGDNAPTYLPIAIEVVAPPEPVVAPPEPEPEPEPIDVEPVKPAEKKDLGLAFRPAPPPPPEPEPIVISPALPYIRTVQEISRQRAATGMKIFVSKEAVESEKPQPIQQTRLSDEEWDRTDLLADDGFFPKTTSTLPVNRDRIITADRHIPAVLETAINSSFAGRAIAVVERDVFGASGRKILIPVGSRVIGVSPSSGGGANPRTEISWSRVLLPNGANIAIDFGSADAMGRMGVVGYVDQQLFERYGLPLLVSAITGAGQIALSTNDAGIGVLNNTGTVTQAIDAPRQRAINEFAQNIFGTLTQIIQDRTQIQPVLIIPAGTRLYIVPTRDIFLRDPETFVAVPATNDAASQVAGLESERRFRAYMTGDRYGQTQGTQVEGDQTAQMPRDKFYPTARDRRFPERPLPGWHSGNPEALRIEGDMSHRGAVTPPPVTNNPTASSASGGGASAASNRVMRPANGQVKQPRQFYGQQRPVAPTPLPGEQNYNATQ